MIELLEILNTCENEIEIREVVDTYIDAYTLLSPDLNISGNVFKTIGRVIDINPKKEFNNFDNSLIANNKWYGYIPDDIKIVYSTTIDEKGYYNEGAYYYIKDREYLYDFANFIKDKDPNMNFDLFISYVFVFMTSYFDNIMTPLIRDDISKLLLNNEGYYINPSKEHDLKQFKNSGCAKCSEYSTMAQNIMSLFGYEMILIFDEKHAYNVLYNNKNAYVVDFQSGVEVLDYSCNSLGKIPFVSYINDYSEKKLDDLLYEGKKIELKDFELHRIVNESIPMENGYKRVYGADKIKKM